MGSRSGGYFPPDQARNIRYVKIQKANGSLAEHSIFLVTKSIEAYCRYEDIWNDRKDGSLTVALSEKYAKKLVENMKELADKTPITVRWDEKRNTSRAVVVCRQLAISPESEIEAELSNQNVTNARHIFRTSNDKKQKINTGVVILTFSCPVPPEKVKIGYRICQTEKYYPRPTQCYRCFEYQHISKFCKNDERCRTCAEKAHVEDEECSNQIKCLNCNENHYSTSKVCKIYRREQQITKIKIDENVPYHTARKKYLNLTGQDSYANKVNNSGTQIEDAKKKWEEEMAEKMKFISQKMEELNKKENEMRNWYAYLKEKDKEIKANMEKMKEETIAMEAHCNTLTNELQKKDDIIKKTHQPSGKPNTKNRKYQRETR